MTEELAIILGLITGLVIVFAPIIAFLNSGEGSDWDNDGWEPEEREEWRPPHGMERRQPRTEVRTYQGRHQRRERPVPGSNGSKVQMSRWIQSRPREEEW